MHDDAAKEALNDVVIFTVVGGIIIYFTGAIGSFVLSTLVLFYVLYTAYRPTGHLKEVAREQTE